jgi:hypothetical protein
MRFRHDMKGVAMRTFILFLLFCAAGAAADRFPTPASAFSYVGWVTGCTNDSRNVLYLDDCATNMQPAGAFDPGV